MYIYRIKLTGQFNKFKYIDNGPGSVFAVFESKHQKRGNFIRGQLEVESIFTIHMYLCLILIKYFNILSILKLNFNIFECRVKLKSIRDKLILGTLNIEKS